MTPLIQGFATEEGTARLKNRQTALAQTHYRKLQNLWLSDLGMGTYLGHWDDATDQLYTEAIMQAVQNGVNVLDSAINYRFMRSERNIGTALRKLITEKKIARDEVLVATKGGYLSFDASPPADPRDYFFKTYFETKVIEPKDIVDGSHCMHPNFIRHELNKSRENLGLDTIDIYYLHNTEYQLNDIPRVLFEERLFNAFSFLEDAVKEGKIKKYGLATWDGFRCSPDNIVHLSLQRVLEIAKEAGGENHHFAVVQLPFNLMFREAATNTSQENGNQFDSFLHIAQCENISVMTSVPLFQGRLLGKLPPNLQEMLGKEYKTDALRAIAFASATPGICTPLVGMSNQVHVAENCSYFQTPRLNIETWHQIIDSLA